MKINAKPNKLLLFFLCVFIRLYLNKNSAFIDRNMSINANPLKTIHSRQKGQLSYNNKKSKIFKRYILIPVNFVNISDNPSSMSSSGRQKLFCSLLFHSFLFFFCQRWSTCSQGELCMLTSFGLSEDILPDRNMKKLSHKQGFNLPNCESSLSFYF